MKNHNVCHIWYCQHSIYHIWYGNHSICWVCCPSTNDNSKVAWGGIFVGGHQRVSLDTGVNQDILGFTVLKLVLKGVYEHMKRKDAQWIAMKTIGNLKTQSLLLTMLGR